MTAAEKIPATIITGFLGAGKTTLVRHILENAGGRRIAIIVNEFGSVGIDGDTLRECGIENCGDGDIVELANGCICCTVAEDFLPTMEALLERDNPPEHILIETSGLALPKPLIKAFDWPAVRSRVTIDGVVSVVDGPAAAGGQFADDPEAVAAQRAADPSLDHDNPLAEVFEDQLNAADMVIVNKRDLINEDVFIRLKGEIEEQIPRAVKIVAARNGKVDISVLLGMNATAEDDIAARPSHHDAMDGEHEHDDFESFVVDVPEIESAEEFVARLQAVTEDHKVLRIKGFAAVRGKPMRLAVQGVGGRFNYNFDRTWRPNEARAGQMVVIGETGLDEKAITDAITGLTTAATPR
jgi:cobalamin biosynthesis protein CobW